MADFLEDLLHEAKENGETAQTTAYLIVPRRARNPAEVEILADALERIARLDLPMVFEGDEGELENPEAFVRLMARRPASADEALRFVLAEIEAVFAGYEELIEYARTMGPNTTFDLFQNTLMQQPE